MKYYMPYIVTILCSFISGFASYLTARRQSKSDIQELVKKHELDIEKERIKFAMEKEKIEIEYKHQLELKQKEMENQLGTNLVATMTKEYMRSPAGQAQMRNASTKSKKK